MLLLSASAIMRLLVLYIDELTSIIHPDTCYDDGITGGQRAPRLTHMFDTLLRCWS